MKHVVKTLATIMAILAVGSASAGNRTLLGDSDFDASEYHWVGSELGTEPDSLFLAYIRDGATNNASRIEYQPDIYYWKDVVVNGTVGIGPGAAGACSTCQLSVKGKVQAESVVVSTSWADYVFDQGYELKPLVEVAEFIETHGHLPGIPSEQEIQNEGLDLGQMQAKMMSKIEELTLYMIELKHENDRLKEELGVLMKVSVND